MKLSKFETLITSMACSALLLFPAAAFAQAAPAKPMGGMHEGMMGHDKMSGMKHGDMKSGMKSSCMSRAGMQKRGMSQKKMTQMGSMCRAEKEVRHGVKPKTDAIKPMPMEHKM